MDCDIGGYPKNIGDIRRLSPPKKWLGYVRIIPELLINRGRSAAQDAGPWLVACKEMIEGPALRIGEGKSGLVQFECGK